MGRLRYIGNISENEYNITEETAGEAKIKNVSDGIDLLKADATTVTDASGVQLASHGTRHQRGAADATDDPNVSNLGDSGDVSCTVGVNNTATRTTVYTPPTNYYAAIPQAIYMAVGGTVASSETVSISVKAVLDDGSEYEIASYSSTGATGSSTEATPFLNLLTNVRAAGANVNEKKITQIVADVKSSATSTSATATVRAIGLIT